MPRKYASLCDRIIANSYMDYDLMYDGTPCWIWLGRRNSSGYAVIQLRWKSGPRKGKVRNALAHRISLMVFRGRRLTTRSVAKHLCNTRLCVNPMHLEGGTQSSNIRQCVQEGRHGNMYRSPVRDQERAA